MRILTQTFTLLTLIIYSIPCLSQVTLTASSGTLTGTFTNLSSAVTAINNGVHKGNIVIKIHANITETATTTLNASGSGSTSYTSIKILPADTATVEKVISISTTGIPLLSLSGASNVIIDGRPNETGSGLLLKFINPNNTAASHVITFSGGATNNIIRFCTLRSSSVGTVAASVVRFLTGANNNNSLLNNRIDGGNLGVEINGTNGTPNNYITINNNLFIDQQATGIRPAAGVGNITANKNDFTHDLGTTTSGYQCINISQIEPGDTFLMTNCKAYRIKTLAANFIHGVFLSPSVASGLAIVRNCSFSLASTALPNTLSQIIRGVLFTGTIPASLIFEHNTVRIGGTHVTANGNPTTMCFIKTNTNTSSSTTVRNNLLINTRTGTTSNHVGIQISSPTAGTNNIDYNTHYGGVMNAVWAGTSYDTLSRYKTAAAPQEQNSEFGIINFLNEDDPDFAPGNMANWVFGTPISDIPTDIYGVPRSLSAPFRGAFEGNPTTLPVKALGLSVYKKSNDAILDWAYMIKEDVIETSVQRSTDGMNFTSIGKVISSNSANNQFKFVDVNILSNGVSNLFYRLEIKDKNGLITYSEIKRLSNVVTERISISLLSNPIIGNLKAIIECPKDNIATISIYNISGMKLLNESRTLEEGINMVEINGTNRLASGSYILVVNQNGLEKSVPFVK